MSTGINVSDIDRSLVFYATVFGLVEINRYEFPGVTEVILRAPAKLDGPGLILASRDRPGEAAPSVDSFGRIVFRVPDAKEAWDRAVACGGTSVREPRSAEGSDVTIAIVRDPDGVSLELVQRPVGSTGLPKAPS